MNVMQLLLARTDCVPDLFAVKDEVAIFNSKANLRFRVIADVFVDVSARSQYKLVVKANCVKAQQFLHHWNV